MDAPSDLVAWVYDLVLPASAQANLLQRLTGDSFGATGVKDLLNLEPDDIDNLKAPLPKLRQKAFVEAIAALKVALALSLTLTPSHSHSHTHTHTHTHTHACACVHTRTRTPAHMNTHAHARTHTHMHPNAHTHNTHITRPLVELVRRKSRELTRYVLLARSWELENESTEPETEF